MSAEIGNSNLTARDKIALLKKQLSEKANKDNAIYPLSYGQKALYFLYLNSPESHAYNVAFTVRILSHLNVDALRRSFQKLINKEPSLRTNYKIIDGKPVQEIRGYKDIFFEIIDVSELDEESLMNKVKAANQIPFELDNGDVFRIYLFRINEDNYIMLMSMHHIASDGWSMGIIFQEIKGLYEAESEGKSTPLQSSEYKYSDYILRQEKFIHSEDGENQWKYWKEELSGELPVLNLPCKPRPAVQTFNGKVEYFNLEKDLVEGLKKLSQTEGTTLFVTLLTAYQIFLSRYSAQDDIIVGTPTAGRNQSEFERVIGYFINPVAIRTCFEKDQTFSHFLKTVKKKVLGAIANQEFPFVLVAERLLQKRDPSRSPIFETFFALQRVQQNDEIQEMIAPGNKGKRVEWGKLTLESFDISQQEGQFDLNIEFVEAKNLFSGALKYNTDLFEAPDIRKMIEHFKNLLTGIVSHPDELISELQLLSDSERDLMINKWNETDFNFEEFDCVHKMIEKQTIETPDSIAVVFEDTSLTYSELNSRSNQLANYLTKSGVKPDTLVGLCMERSLEMVVGMLGILKAGGAYIPIDPSYPQNRVEFMISNSNAKVLITQKHIVDHLPQNISNFILIDDDWNKIAGESGENFQSAVELDNLAYMIYTSGSTGMPKGVMITHRALANHMMWLKNAFQFDSSDSLLQKTPFSFDSSGWEFYLPLIIGGRLVMAVPDGHMDTAYLVNTIIKNSITIIQFVPSLFRMFLNEQGIENCTSLKFINCIGEALTYDLTEKLFEKLDLDFYNFYGPTEATMDATYYKCEADSKNKSIPIGKPLYNTQAYILDKFLNPVPVGVTGELFLGGVQIAKGYFNRPELTQEKFINDIFSDKPGGQLYKTGDLTKYLHDGNIEFIGRADQQVKLRGFRIELGEIETVLSRHNKIKEAAVIVREDKPGAQKLTAYTVFKNGSLPSSNELKEYLRSSLPEYMIPLVFITLEKLPLTPNGKLDKKSLPAPDIAGADLDNFIEPKLLVEITLADIWKEVLGVDKVGLNDNFFELGGDSIISIQIISKANQSGIKLSPKQIFQFQTIGQLAKVIDYKEPAISEQNIITGNIDLTPVQKWFFEQNFSEPGFYNHSVILEIPKSVDADKMKESLRELIINHDSLRIKFVKKDSGWEQFNSDINGTIPFYVEDFSHLRKDEINSAIEKSIKNNISGFDLSNDFLIRLTLFKTNSNIDDKLLIVIHHLCVDTFSSRIVFEDLSNLYEQLSGKEKIQLPSKTDSFKKWSSELNSYSQTEKMKTEKNYWLSAFDSKINSIPVDFINDNTKNNLSSECVVQAGLDKQLTESLLTDVSKIYNTGINDILLSALIMSYNEWTSEDSLLISLEGHGRESLKDDLDVSRTAGWFTSIFPVILKLPGKNDVAATIKYIKETLRQIPNNGIGFGMLKYLTNDQRLNDKIRNLPKPEIIFNYLGQFSQNIGNSGWKLNEDTLKLSQNKNNLRTHLIEINSHIVNNRLKMNFVFSSNFHMEKTIESFAKKYEATLKKIIKHCINFQSRVYTPSDFNASGLDQQELDNLIENLNI